MQPLNTFSRLAFCLLALMLLGTPAIAKNYSVEDFFKNPQYSQMTVSPNGKYMAAIAPANGRRNLAIIDLKDRSKSRFITALDDQDVAGYTWVSDDRIIFAIDADGIEAIAMYAVDRKGGRITTLINPLESNSAGPGGIPSPTLLDTLDDDKKHVLVSYDSRRVGVPDVYRMNVRNGGMKMIERNPGTVTGWVTDHDGKIRGAFAQDKLFTEAWYRKTEDDEWEAIARFSWDDRNAFQPLGFDYDNKTWFVSSQKDHDTAAIYKFNPETQEYGEMIFHNDTVDAGGLIFSDAHEKVVAATYYDSQPRWHGLDEDYTQMRKALEASFPDLVVTLASANKDEDLFIVATTSDVDPGSFYLYDRKSQKLEFLAEPRSWIEPEDMAPLKPITYTTRDGMTIHGYLTLPTNGNTKDLPLIVNPHGGPWARDFWGFNSEHQFLANRGYAVLQMNFRGSTGYGRTHLEASYKQWGRKMQDDITDAVSWAIDEGYADEDRICIYGGSYGGYATMAGVTTTPDLYKCGVNYVGVVDIALLFDTMPKAWNLGKEQMKQQVGDPVADAEMLAEASPINHVDKIKAPIFIVHGRKDPRVKYEHATRLRKEMEEHNKPYEWMVKDNEGHGFAKEENRIELYTAMEKFFDKHIGETSGP
ncbi:MAG: prolyl oligopeptidase family serine peptidase [Lysobacterales bacterium]